MRQDLIPLLDNSHTNEMTVLNIANLNQIDMQRIATFFKEKRNFEDFLRVKAVARHIEIGAMAAGLPGALIGSGSGYIFVSGAVLFSLIVGLVIGNERYWNNLGRISIACLITIGSAFGLITAIPGVLVGLITSPLSIASLLRSRAFLYTATQIQKVVDTLAQLKATKNFNLMYSLSGEILAKYRREGSDRYATSESKKLIKDLEDNLYRVNPAEAIIDYLTDKEKLNILGSENACSNFEAPRNQGKRLFNTIIGVVSGCHKRQKIGSILFLLSNMKVRNGDGQEITTLFNVVPVLECISSFIDSNYNSLLRVISDIKSICDLQKLYNSHVGFWEHNARKDIFKPGENYNTALIRLVEKARGKSKENASVKTIIELLEQPNDTSALIEARTNTTVSETYPICALFRCLPKAVSETYAGATNPLREL